ncbi:MAG: SusD/RagB family nutrient-binding outer membrane lipoprotein [Chitinophagaceae bacterium]|nr:SusD/RagB family nutrient-binding outer membrane lipoprotein [Chitinophagaceae bacterium]
MKKIILYVSAGLLLGSVTSCQKYLDINQDPDRIVENKAPMDLLLTNVTVNTGFTGGSDLFRYPALIMQQFTAQTQGGEVQTQQYEKYLLQSSDVNNLWSTFNAAILNDIEVIIKQSTANNSPHYRGVAKLLKAYNYQHLVDAFGNIPFSEAQQTSANTSPKYDDAAAIYNSLLTLIDEGLADLNQTTSAFVPGTNSTIYSGNFSTRKANWIKFGNTLKLRLLIHYSKVDKPGMVSKITALVNNPSATFFASNADNFEMPFFNVTDRQNPIHQFEIRRPNYLFGNKYMIDMMNSKSDPRRATFFVQFPAGSGNYLGGTSGAPQSQNFSRMHTYLRGAASGGVPTSSGAYNPLPTNTPAGITYDGTAPIRMLTYAEYNFIRAEAAVYGAPGVAQTFFQEGIRASMQAAGVAAGDITTYLATNGILTGTTAQMVEQIINEKYIASYGVMQECWSDWRRTGFPTITKVSNAVTPEIPRILPYPQSEADANRSFPGQKSDLHSTANRTFWDK